jgi:regulator of sigma E protease
MAHEDFGFLASIPAGIRFGVETLGNYVSGMKLIFSASGAKQVGGFGTLGSLFSPTWDWQVFWSMTAFLSIVLAFMNILPIPALDGGHVVFLVYEMVFRRAPNQRVLEVAQMVGMFLLLGLLLFANGNDLFKAITGGNCGPSSAVEPALRPTVTVACCGVIPHETSRRSP